MSDFLSVNNEELILLYKNTAGSYRNKLEELESLLYELSRDKNSLDKIIEELRRRRVKIEEG